MAGVEYAHEHMQEIGELPPNVEREPPEAAAAGSGTQTDRTRCLPVGSMLCWASIHSPNSGAMSIQGLRWRAPLPIRPCSPAPTPLKLAASSRFASPDGSATRGASSPSLRCLTVSPPDTHRRTSANLAEVRRCVSGEYREGPRRDSGCGPALLCQYGTAADPDEPDRRAEMAQSRAIARTCFMPNTRPERRGTAGFRMQTRRAVPRPLQAAR